MLIVCCVCHIRLGRKAGRGTSHGYCRRHELEAMEKENLLSEGEKEELEAIRNGTGGRVLDARTLHRRIV